MAGEIDPGIGEFAPRFGGIEPEPDTPTAALNPLVVFAEGPLSQGLANVHETIARSGHAFADEMRRGIADTGVILGEVGAEYGNIDQNSAESIRGRFAEQPGAPGNAPEGGR
jgi:hypothetical protein